MLGQVPTFGIDAYAEKVARLMSYAPREMTLTEGGILGGLGACAVIMLGLALVRRSALAAVSFSFLALTGLVAALVFGRLDFVPEGTQTLIICLFACSVLLFITATVRVARENPIVGALVLIVIAALLVVGGASALNVVDGWPLATLGLGFAGASIILFLGLEFFRGDKPTIAVSPGLVALLLAPGGMAYVGSQGGDQGWLVTALPIILMAAGAVYAAIAGQIAISLAARQTQAAVSSAAGLGPAAAAGSVMFQELDDDVVPPAPVDEADPAPAPPLFEEITDDEPQPAPPPPARAPRPAAKVEPVPEPAPVPERAPSYEPQEPVSSQWGRAGAAMASTPVIADDEYVWDMMASQEVKIGDGFAGLFGLGTGRLATPDVLRDAVAPVSLPEFDEAVLGGSEPLTGRFEIDLTLENGGVVHVEGRRQVDHDGLLARLEACATASSAPPAMAAPAAPMAAAPAVAVDSDMDPAIAALEQGRIEAHFQPIVRLSDRRTVGFEALARWRRDDGTVVDAKDFIHRIISRDRGLDLARLVIEKAAAELSAWIAAEPNQGQFVTVNIEASDLPKDELKDIIAAAVSAYKLPTGALVVEMTEGRIQASQSRAMAAAKAVRNAGASLAIDDFGVGYSTLSRLSKFHFDLIKTDKSLIDDITRSKKQRSVMTAIISTARKSGSPVIAEGIEDEETAARCLELGCDFGQGYLFGAAEPLGGAPASEEPPSPGGVGTLR